MAVSARYNQFVNRVARIESLLPAIDPTGAYTERDTDLIRSYCLLCHAEIEAYLEDIALEVVDRAMTTWNNNQSIITPIIFHLAFSYKKFEMPFSMVHQGYQQLKRTIEKNHGIKEDNLNSFFRPIGVNIDTTLTNTLTSFGRTRGEIAHSAFHTQSQLDPLSEKNNVNQIISGLATFDEDLSNYERSGNLPRTPIITQWRPFTFTERLKILFTGTIDKQL
ncbi:HEPN domain-containing protein [Mucilaginibacter sp. X4EP1]|uniref:HEPN domain-containing protein n=1 Tax=Mucilaginibacter sp. X4EP1 TaxID=2723092 RepID=UPI0021694C78|nr:HEPN domain-containing protein [Mucilaginibacter sp. X4EP1]MCS3815518.1 hypothetical protein [Mucilaginibacter sp. X4EP1]